MKSLNPADYPTYNVGDEVTIRQWDDMESEFGLDKYGGIKVPKTFTEFMKKYCGQTLFFDGTSVVFSSPMFEQSKLQSVPPSSLSFDSLLQGGDFF